MADGDLERRLNEVLRERVGGFKPSGDLPARIGARTRERAHNRRVAASVAGVALLLGIAAPLALRDRDEGQVTAARVAESGSATSLAGLDAAASDTAGATSRAGEGGADTTAAAADDAGGATTAVATEVAPAPAASSPPAAPGATTTAPVGVFGDTDRTGPPPYLLAVMPGDPRVALVSSTTGEIVRYVEGTDPTGQVFYDQAGEYVFRAGGCGTTAQGVAVSGDDAIVSDTAWRDAVAISAWGSGVLRRFAWVTDNSCNGGSGFTLTLRTSAGDRSLPVPDVHALAFSADGATLVWSDSDGLGTLDANDPDSALRRSPSPDPGCPVAAVSGIGGTARVAVITECAGDPARLFTLDPTSGDAPQDQGTGFAEVDAIDFDATAQWIAVTHSSGVDVVSAVTSDIVATIPAASSVHWTAATG